ncbi:MAG TPA: thiamine phosphate synthase [Candidatus Binatia bacterium]|nr:thiamine phosphate synthase [Candidatus Binatia bacterium]
MSSRPPFRFPHRLYPIIDTLGDPQRSHVEIADAMLAAGVPWLQLRIKDGPTRRFVEVARIIQARARAAGAQLIINDRADIALLVEAAGVHLGQTDLPAADARRILGPDAIIGVSTHSVEQVRQATRTGAADYLGFGPVFPTSSKRNPDPVQGLDGVRRARAATGLPLVAIGGITRATMSAVLAAGADAVAMIRDLVATPDIRARVAECLEFVKSGA